ncbi:MAG: AbrB/MazE/SpoVT family DNA-binding domain-containing protein [Pseudomonadota bacterium]
MRQTLRKAGGSLVMTIPKSFVEQNKLSEGSQVELVLSGKKLLIEVAQKPKYRLADLLAEMPEELPKVEGWDTLPDVGEEIN